MCCVVMSALPQIDVAKCLCNDFPIRFKIARKVELESMMEEELEDSSDE